MQYSMGTRYGSLASAVHDADDVTLEPGHSGYFSSPQPMLDPHLFYNGEYLRPEVTSFLLNTLFNYLSRWYKDPVRWATPWLAGSGISYQWAGDRGNGDLDVLVGVDLLQFTASNPEYAHYSEIDIDDRLTAQLKSDLWPETARTNINGQIYDVTYFVNRRASDIRSIHPYAAYNLLCDEWTVRPPELPKDPRSLYPEGYWSTSRLDTRGIGRLVDEYNHHKRLVKLDAPNSGSFVSHTVALSGIVKQALSAFRDIHDGRRDAFSATGEGYSDWANFRWQAQKASGGIAALQKIIAADDIARVQQEQTLYGTRVMPADEALRSAALWQGQRHR